MPNLLFSRKAFETPGFSSTDCTRRWFRVSSSDRLTMALLQASASMMSAAAAPVALSGAACTGAGRHSSSNLRSVFVGRGVGGRGTSGRQTLAVQNGSRVSAWFKFGKNGVDSQSAGIYGSQERDDFDRDDVEQYFNYMGMLATEGTYDKMDALLDQGIPAVDILLLMASSEGDQPKVEELLQAGALTNVPNAEGKTAIDLAANDTIRQLILSNSKANV